MTSTIDTSRWLADPDLARLFGTLEAIGETRFIGGAVRDAWLGLPHADIDLATPARPDLVLRTARAAGFKVVPTGLDHGTVTVVLPRGPVEVTTLRRDVETDGRHAEVAFTADWQADAARRDFTINALSADRDGIVHDHFGGLEDLKARRVRFIGDPLQRIREDYLRILRFFRFSARYAEGLDEPALAAIRASAGEMGMLSGERILSEMLRLLGGPNCADMWRAMIDAGVVAAILPEATDVQRLQGLIEIERSFLPPVRQVTDPFRRLLALLPSPPPDMDAIARRLKLSSAQRHRLERAVLPPERLNCVERGDWAHALYKAEPESIVDAVLLLAAGGKLARKRVKDLVRFAVTWQEPTFPLGGENLMELGLKPGPIFGALLREVEAWWVAEDFLPTRQQCFAELKKIWFGRKQAGGY